VIEAIKTDKSGVRFLAVLLSFLSFDQRYAFAFSAWGVDKGGPWL
jgi:hypothetical protein